MYNKTPVFILCQTARVPRITIASSGAREEDRSEDCHCSWHFESKYKYKHV